MLISEAERAAARSWYVWDTNDTPVIHGPYSVEPKPGVGEVFRNRCSQWRVVRERRKDFAGSPKAELQCTLPGVIGGMASFAIIEGSGSLRLRTYLGDPYKYLDYVRTDQAELLRIVREEGARRRRVKVAPETEGPVIPAPHQVRADAGHYYYTHGAAETLRDKINACLDFDTLTQGENGSAFLTFGVSGEAAKTWKSIWTLEILTVLRVWGRIEDEAAESH